MLHVMTFCLVTAVGHNGLNTSVVTDGVFVLAKERDISLYTSVTPGTSTFTLLVEWRDNPNLLSHHPFVSRSYFQQLVDSIAEETEAQQRTEASVSYQSAELVNASLSLMFAASVLTIAAVYRKQAWLGRCVPVHCICRFYQDCSRRTLYGLF